MKKHKLKIIAVSLLGIGLVAGEAQVSQADTTASADGDSPAARTSTAPRVAQLPTRFGATVQPGSGQNYREARVAADRKYGRMEVIRYFDPNLPNSWRDIRNDVGRHRVVISFNASPQAINSGRHDRLFRSWFAHAPESRVNWWSYNPEPESDVSGGQYTARQYRKAWRRLDGLAERAHNPRLKSTLALMCYTLNSTSHRNWRDYYVASAVNVLSWDCYNWGHKRGIYAHPSTSFDKVVRLSNRIGKPWAIAEVGSIKVGSDDGSRRAEWLKKVGRYADRHNARFATYFDVRTAFDYRLRDRPSKRAWRRVVNHNYS